MKRPIVTISFSLACGIVGGYLCPSFPWFISVIAGLSALCLLASSTSRTVVCVCLNASIFFFGAAYYRLYDAHTALARNIISGYAARPVWIGGTVTAQSDYFGDSPVNSFIIKTDQIRDSSTAIPLRVHLRVKKWGLSERLHYGEHIGFQGRLVLPVRKRNFKTRSPVRTDNIRGIVYSGKRFRVEKIKGPDSRWSARAIYTVRDRILAFFSQVLERENAVLISAMLLGERRSLPKNLKDTFRRSGIMHLLAISGLHTGIIALVFMSLLNGLRINRRAVWAITSVGLIVYAVMTGCRTPVVRSVIMGEIMLIGLILDRDVEILNSLAVAGIMILLVSPVQLFDIGFQLSFTAVATIGLCIPFIRRSKTGYAESPRRVGGRLYTAFLKRFRAMLVVSTAAWIGTMPLVAYYFGVFTPAGLVANLILIPYAFILVSAGAFLAVATLWQGPGLNVAGYIVDMLVNGFTGIAEVFSSLPWGHITLDPMPAWWVFLWYGSLFLLLITVNQLAQQKNAQRSAGKN